MKELTGILLCGGKSERMGTDKALLEIRKQPMALYPLKVLQKWCSEIIISANDARLEFLDYPIIPDEFKDIGPMGGLYTCLKQSKYDLNLVFACDMPLVKGSIVEKMLQVDHVYDAIVPVMNNRTEPLYAIYHKQIIPKIKHTIEQKTYSLQKLLSQASIHYIEIDYDEFLELFNVNTPAELLNYGQFAGNNI